MTPRPAPLVFEPIFKEKVWGGRALEALGKALPAGKQIGESWELVDLSSTSASGGGGDAAHSPIARGPLRGRTLRDAIAAWGTDLLGDLPLTPEGGFPLLVKFLDARENLSVQVHPSPAYARAHPGSHLKTESWFVLDAAPGAAIYKGVRPGVTRDSFARHIADGSCAEDLVAVPVRAGDFHHLPSGTVHALGAGVVVAEVQTPSDTTFRVFDWGRAGRELHVAQALECIDFTPEAAPPRQAALAPGDRRKLVDAGHYAIERTLLRAGETASFGGAGRPVVVMALAGGGAAAGANGEPAPINGGETMLIPAACGDAALRADERGLDALIVTFPRGGQAR